MDKRDTKWSFLFVFLRNTSYWQRESNVFWEEKWIREAPSWVVNQADLSIGILNSVGMLMVHKLEKLFTSLVHRRNLAQYSRQQKTEVPSEIRKFIS